MSQKVKLTFQSPEIQYLCRQDKHLAKVIHMIGPIEYEIQQNGYGFLVGEIMGQMVSNKVAAIFVQRLKAKCDQSITPERIETLSDKELRDIGISNSKVSYIRNVTKAFNDGEILATNFENKTDQEILATLTSVKGIGNWSAKMYLIFVLNRPNVLPYEDLAFLQGYGWMWNTDDYRKQSVSKRCKKWSPYASIAARYMYQALDRGYTKEKFHLFKK
ncbi:DNA-3-methyladenine glycosylase family protein [Secundilactobacillus folii]|uniref:DNA-3-methyladenine glycosylase family protein n=1 Tax=Secundilactobacillus folii TaxID=2678357 RepID=UPI003CCD65A4